MLEHKKLLKFATDEDDYPVILYLAKVGKVIDWKESLPDEVLYIPEEIFQSVARKFIDTIGPDRYYSKVILDKSHIESLCGKRTPSEYSERYQTTLAAIREFINSGSKISSSYYIAFEAP